MRRKGEIFCKAAGENFGAAELERRARWYRRARLHARPPEGWLRAMRLAVGIPAEEIAGQMGFTARMVFQTERAEQKRNITLERLERMARALGCDLVYGLVPWERSLEDRAMELVEREMWRKRYTSRRQGNKGMRERGNKGTRERESTGVASRA